MTIRCLELTDVAWVEQIVFSKPEIKHIWSRVASTLEITHFGQVVTPKSEITHFWSSRHSEVGDYTLFWSSRHSEVGDHAFFGQGVTPYPEKIVASILGNCP